MDRPTWLLSAASWMSVSIIRDTVNDVHSVLLSYSLPFTGWTIAPGNIGFICCDAGNNTQSLPQPLQDACRLYARPTTQFCRICSVSNVMHDITHRPFICTARPCVQACVYVCHVQKSLNRNFVILSWTMYAEFKQGNRDSKLRPNMRFCHMCQACLQCPGTAYWLDAYSIHCVSKKQYTYLSIITSANVSRFLKFFHCQIPKETLYTTLTRFSASPYVCVYTTLWNLKITFTADFNGILHVTPSSCKIRSRLNSSDTTFMTIKYGKQRSSVQKRNRDVSELK